MERVDFKVSNSNLITPKLDVEKAKKFLDKLHNDRSKPDYSLSPELLRTPFGIANSY